MIRTVGHDSSQMREYIGSTFLLYNFLPRSEYTHFIPLCKHLMPVLVNFEKWSSDIFEAFKKSLSSLSDRVVHPYLVVLAAQQPLWVVLILGCFPLEFPLLSCSIMGFLVQSLVTFLSWPDNIAFKVRIFLSLYFWDWAFFSLSVFDLWTVIITPSTLSS